MSQETAEVTPANPTGEPAQPAVPNPHGAQAPGYQEPVPARADQVPPTQGQLPPAQAPPTEAYKNFSFLLWLPLFWTVIGVPISQDCDSGNCAEDQKDTYLGLGIFGLLMWFGGVGLNLFFGVYPRAAYMIGEAALIALAFVIQTWAIAAGAQIDCNLDRKSECSDKYSGGLFVIGIIGIVLFLGFAFYFKSLANVKLDTVGAGGVWSFPRSGLVTFVLLILALEFVFQEFANSRCIDDAGNNLDDIESCLAYSGFFHLVFSLVALAIMVLYFLFNWRLIIDFNVGGPNLGKPVNRAWENYCLIAVVIAFPWFVFFTATKYLCLSDKGVTDADCSEDNDDGALAFAIIALIIGLVLILADAGLRVVKKVRFI